MEVPKYKVTNWAKDGDKITFGADSADSGLVVYHTPGHTPDELAVWDPQERVLFVGDTLYEFVPIVFPLEGNLQLYQSTLMRLKSLVEGWNAMTSSRKSGC
jgi:glyoxylase-like metal-dependent hydrolase (beta-lactamase superfamily II)